MDPDDALEAMRRMNCEWAKTHRREQSVRHFETDCHICGDPTLHWVCLESRNAVLPICPHCNLIYNLGEPHE